MMGCGRSDDGMVGWSDGRMDVSVNGMMMMDVDDRFMVRCDVMMA